MKLIAVLLFSTLIAPGIAVCMDVNYAQEDREGTADQQQTSAAQHEGYDRGKDKDKDRHAANEDGFLTEAPAKGVSVDHLIGSEVRSQADNENIGTADDILIDQDGRPLAVVISAGGFLGIGEKDVAVDWDKVEVKPNGEEGFLERTGDAITRTGGVREGEDMADADRADDAVELTPSDYVLVVDVSREMLENAPEFDRGTWNNY